MNGFTVMDNLYQPRMISVRIASSVHAGKCKSGYLKGSYLDDTLAPTVPMGSHTMTGSSHNSSHSSLNNVHRHVYNHIQGTNCAIPHTTGNTVDHTLNHALSHALNSGTASAGLTSKGLPASSLSTNTENFRTERTEGSREKWRSRERGELLGAEAVRNHVRNRVARAREESTRANEESTRVANNIDNDNATSTVTSAEQSQTNEQDRLSQHVEVEVGVGGKKRGKGQLEEIGHLQSLEDICKGQLEDVGGLSPAPKLAGGWDERSNSSHSSGSSSSSREPETNLRRVNNRHNDRDRSLPEVSKALLQVTAFEPVQVHWSKKQESYRSRRLHFNNIGLRSKNITGAEGSTSTGRKSKTVDHGTN